MGKREEEEEKEKKDDVEKEDGKEELEESHTLTCILIERISYDIRFRYLEAIFAAFAKERPARSHACAILNLLAAWK